jgi:hypothetical protein
MHFREGRLCLTYSLVLDSLFVPFPDVFALRAISAGIDAAGAAFTPHELFERPYQRKEGS